MHIQSPDMSILLQACAACYAVILQATITTLSH